MASKLNPYINFKDKARQAMEFYHSVFGGTLNVMTFAQGGMPVQPGEQDLVMHAQLDAPNGFTLMGSDAPSHIEFRPGNTMSISLSGEDEAELKGYWDGLSDGATITQPLVAAPWGDQFGMLTDRFGTAWMVNIASRRH